VRFDVERGTIRHRAMGCDIEAKPQRAWFDIGQTTDFDDNPRHTLRSMRFRMGFNQFDQ
jgi:hypothetical protein